MTMIFTFREKKTDKQIISNNTDFKTVPSEQQIIANFNTTEFED